MTRDITTINIVLEIAGTEYVHRVEGTHWAWSPDGSSLYVYDETGSAANDDPLIEVDADHFAGAFREDRVETTDSIDSITI